MIGASGQTNGMIIYRVRMRGGQYLGIRGASPELDLGGAGTRCEGKDWVSKAKRAGELISLSRLYQEPEFKRLRDPI